MNNTKLFDGILEKKLAEARAAAADRELTAATQAARAEIEAIEAAERAEAERQASIEQQAAARVNVQQPLAELRKRLEQQPALYLALLQAWAAFMKNIDEGQAARRQAANMLLAAGIADEFEIQLSQANVPDARGLATRWGASWSFSGLHAVGMPDYSEARGQIGRLITSIFNQ